MSDEIPLIILHNYVAWRILVGLARSKQICIRGGHTDPIKNV